MTTWAQRNPDKAREVNRAWRKQNADRCRQNYKRWAEKNPEKAKEKALRYSLAHPGRANARSKAWRIELRLQALAAYGAFCVCCNENQDAFLTIDHIGGGGAAHRRSINHRSIYLWLKKNGYPVGFRVLCMNCNWATARGKKCPHER